MAAGGVSTANHGTTNPGNQSQASPCPAPHPLAGLASSRALPPPSPPPGAVVEAVGGAGGRPPSHAQHPFSPLRGRAWPRPWLPESQWEACRGVSVGAGSL